jgi:hypothetical protein
VKILTILLFSLLLLIPFQNCAVYKSEGRKAFDSTIEQAENVGCYPFIDSNLAMQYLGILDGSLNIYKNNVSGESAVVCDFRSADPIFNHVNCKVSQGNADLALLLVQQGMNAFEDTQSVWNATATPGFHGSTFGGFVTLDDDGLDTIMFLAVDGSESKGVGCSVHLTPAAYSSSIAKIQSALSKITFEMAINNQ